MAREEIIYSVEVEDKASERLRRLNRHLEHSRRGFQSFAYEGNRAAAPMSTLTSMSKGLRSPLMGLATAGGVAQAALAALAVRGFGVAIESAVEFEQAVQNAVAVTGGSFEQIAEAATQASFSSAFSATEAAKAMELLGMAGLNAEQAVQALPGTLQLAAAGSLDLARAADISTNIMSGFRMEMSDLAHVNDVLAHTATNANINVEEMGTFMGYVAPIAQSSGQSIEMMAAAAGLLGNAGLAGEKGAIAMRTGLLNLQAPTAAARATLKDLNIEVNDSAGNMRAVDEILRDLGQAQASQAELTAIFGKRAVAGIGVLIKDVDELSKRSREAQTSIEGAARALEQTKLDSVDGQLRILTGSLKSTAAEFGGVFTPSIKGALKETNAYISAGQLLKEELLELKSAVNDNREAIDGLATGSIAAAIAGVSDLAEGVSAVGSALSTVAAPVTWVAEKVGVLSDTGNPAADTAYNLANGVRLVGTAAAAAFTMVNPLVGGLGVLYGAFTDVKDEAYETAEQIQAFKRIADFKEQAQQARNDLKMLATSVVSAGTQMVTKYVEQVEAGLDAANAEKERLAFEARYFGLRQRALESRDEIEAVRLERDAELLKLTREDMDAAERAYKVAKLRADADAKIADIMDRRAQDAKREADQLERTRKSAMDILHAARETAREMATRERRAWQELEIISEVDELERAKLERELELERIRSDSSLTNGERRLEQARAEQRFAEELLRLNDERAEADARRREEGRAEREREREREKKRYDEATQRISDAARILDGVGEGFGDGMFARTASGLATIAAGALDVGAAMRTMHQDGAGSAQKFAGAMAMSGQVYAQAADAFGASQQQISAGLAVFYGAEAIGRLVFKDYAGAAAAAGAAIAHGAYAASGAGAGSSNPQPVGAGTVGGAGSTLTPFSGRGDVDADQRRLAGYIGDELERRAQGAGGVNITFQVGTLVGDDREAMRQMWDAFEREGRARGVELGRVA